MAGLYLRKGLIGHFLISLCAFKLRHLLKACHGPPWLLHSPSKPALAGLKWGKAENEIPVVSSS